MQTIVSKCVFLWRRISEVTERRVHASRIRCPFSCTNLLSIDYDMVAVPRGRAWHTMRTVAIHVAWSVCLSVFVSVSPAEPAEGMSCRLGCGLVAPKEPY